MKNSATEIRVALESKNEYETRYNLKMWDSSETCVSWKSIRFIDTSFGDGFVKTMTSGGVGTPPEYRRNGYVREMFKTSFDIAMENDAVVGLLHPFSFSYYNKFAYEKVADHLIVRCPVRMIDFVPRCTDLVPYTETEEQTNDLIAIYNTFSKDRNLLTRRYNGGPFSGKRIYIYYRNGKPEGYISFNQEQTLRINHFEDGVMVVSEMVYTTPEALEALFGFIRMFEGELDDVLFENIAMCPEVERSLRHYTHTSYTILPDLSARILNTEKLLKAYKYPKHAGHFTMNVIDTLPTVAGAFDVEYADGKCEVKRLSDPDKVQLTIGSSELVRLLYGYDPLTPEQAAYTKGICINENADDFFRALRKQVGGVFEHF